VVLPADLLDPPTTYKRVGLQMSERIDLTNQIQEICRRLNVDYGNIAEITLTPADATVTLLKTNAQGSRYFDPKTDRAATETLIFQIRS
jgi:hypothetical protein